MGVQFWNATDTCCNSYHQGVNDVQYLTDLIKKVVLDYQLDSNRIYLIGHSAGGYMENRLACEHGEMFAGFASFAGGGYLDEKMCLHPVPNSYLQIHAVNDASVAFDSDLKHLDYAGGKQVIGQWINRNHCIEGLHPTQRLDLIKAIDSDDTQEFRASNCAGHRDVVLWAIDAHNSALYVPHVPALKNETASKILDFLFSHVRTQD